MEKTKESWYDESVALKDDKGIDAAIAELRKLLVAYPDFGLAHLALSVYLEKIGMKTESLAEVRAACALEKTNPFYYTAMSALAIKQGDHDMAEEGLMKAQEIRFAAIIEDAKKERQHNDAESEESRS